MSLNHSQSILAIREPITLENLPVNQEGMTWPEFQCAAGGLEASTNRKNILFSAWERGEDPSEYRATASKRSDLP